MIDVFHLGHARLGFTIARHITVPAFLSTPREGGCTDLSPVTESRVADRPGRSRSPRLRRRDGLVVLPALFCPAGCSQSPAQEILGSFFPAWMLCSAIGIAAALLCRVVLGMVRSHQHVFAPAFTYLAIAVAVTLFTWLIWFGQ